MVAPELTLVRFGRWEEVLREPAPALDLPLPAILHHYARARAQAALGKLDEAERELAAMQKSAGALPKDAMAGFTPAADYAGIAIDVVRGDLLCRRGKMAEGLARLQAAVTAQDKMPYAEPPDWYYPTRQTLGAWLLKAKKPADAAKVFGRDLEQNPDNGWSLAGLREALRAQKKPTTAVEAKLKTAWGQADTTLASSDF